MHSLIFAVIATFTPIHGGDPVQEVAVVQSVSEYAQLANDTLGQEFINQNDGTEYIVTDVNIKVIEQ